MSILIIIFDMVIIYSVLCMGMIDRRLYHKGKNKKYNMSNVDKSKETVCNMFGEAVSVDICISDSVNKIPKLILQHDYG